MSLIDEIKERRQTLIAEVRAATTQDELREIEFVATRRIGNTEVIKEICKHPEIPKELVCNTFIITKIRSKKIRFTIY